MVHEGNPDHLVDVFDESDLPYFLDLLPQGLHEVVVNDVLNVEGHDVFELGDKYCVSY